MNILEQADYQSVRHQKDLTASQALGDTNDLCTCTEPNNRNHRWSKSIDFSARSVRGSLKARDEKDKQVQRREPVFAIQLRPLKGKAALMKEFRSKIEAEYGIEKKK